MSVCLSLFCRSLVAGPNTYQQTNASAGKTHVIGKDFRVSTVVGRITGPFQSCSWNHIYSSSGLISRQALGHDCLAMTPSQ